MKKRSSILFCLFFVLSANFISAQPTTIKWQKTYGGSETDNVSCIHQTTDGGYIIAGNTASNNGNVSGSHGLIDYWVVKTDATGNITWQKALGGSADDNAQSIQQTSDGGYIVAGYTGSNDGDVTGNNGSYDCWVVKLTSTGNIAWQKTLGSDKDEKAACIQQTADGGYILAGSIGMNNTDGLVMKLDAAGNLLWERNLGGTEVDFATSIKQTNDGGYILAGGTISNDGDVSGNHGGFDAWVVKLSSTGDLTWQKTLGGTEGETANSIEQTADGGYIFSGWTASNNGDISGNNGSLDFWIVKLSATGTVTWQKALGGPGDELAQSVKQTSDGGYIVAGSSTSSKGQVSGNKGDQDFWVIKLNSTGNLMWQEAMGGSSTDNPSSVQQTADGGYIIAGTTASNNGDVSGNHGSNDYWVVKLESEVICDRSSNQQINVCHNGNTISIHPCALQPHLAHGDYQGQCITYTSTRGIQNIVDPSKTGFSIYPNTGRGNFVVAFNSNINQAKDGVMQIINVSGQVIKELKIQEAGKLNIYLKLAGVYFIRFVSNNKILTKKITVIP